ncbi:acireductone synthase [Rhizobium puerariae]|uniref:Enolase-phosphatase E1 n=1 Tax=Rhizobium puerariae TaxID=1585791 RepID=A0ABV6AAG5_9HYPH
MTVKYRFFAGLVLVDIEGTISPISFVRDTLFAYSCEHLASFLAERGHEPAVAAILEETREQSGDADALRALLAWQEQDIKAPPLKKLQGLIWERGYTEGAYKAPLYPDVLGALEAWKAIGLPVHVYSSGSVKAQELFFRYSTVGDIRARFAGFHDTGVGNKQVPASYGRIIEIAGIPASSALFFSDNAGELAAASDAGLQVVQVVKDGTVADARFPQISSFDQIAVDPA